MQAIDHARKKAPVGGSRGHFIFAKSGETFDSRIGGGGNVFFSRFDEEHIEGTFLMPIVQSTSACTVNATICRNRCETWVAIPRGEIKFR